MRAPIPIGRGVGRSEPLTAHNLVNMYPEQAPDGGKSRVVLHGTPGLTMWATLSGASVQALKVWNGTLYALSGGVLYSINSAGSETDLGSTGITGEAHIHVSDDQLVIADGGFGFLDGFFVFGGSVSEGWVYDTTNGLQEITDDDFAAQGTSSFFISAIGDALSYNGLDFASAEALPDPITHLIVDNRDVWIFGEDSIELWRNTGEPDFPLSRVNGGTIQRYGTKAPRTVQSLDNTIAYLDTFGTVRRVTRGQSPQRISTHSVEHVINEANQTDRDNAYAFVYVEEGHEFYALTIPNNATMVYDAATQEWHDRKSNGYKVWRPSSYERIFDKHLVGDEQSGTIFEMDLDTYDEDGKALIAEITFPPVQADGARFTVHEYQLDFEPGVGLTTGQGSDPKAMLEISDNGRTWKPIEPWRSLGKKGEYNQRTIWRRLGQHRNLHTRVSISDPVKRALYAVYPVIEQDGR